MTDPALRAVYVVAAVAAFVLSFRDLFDRVVDGDFTKTYGSLYDMAGRGAGAPAALGLILLYALTLVLLVLGIRGSRKGAGQVAVIAICLLAILMLVAKPGTNDPQPDLAAGGIALLVLAIVLALVAFADLRTMSAERSRG